MIEALRRFITEITSPDGGGGASDPENDVRLAAAALMVHVVGIDGVVEEDEREKLRGLLKERFELDEDAVSELVTAADRADQEAVDLYGFTSVLKRNLDIAGRERIVGMMWRLVFADGRMHEFEDNLIWRVSELLGVSGTSRIKLKQEARDGVG